MPSLIDENAQPRPSVNTHMIAMTQPGLYKRDMQMPDIHSFDIALVLLPLLGGLWGWFNGGLRSAVKLFFIFAPSIALGYYGDQVAAIGNTIGDMLGDRTSVPLGIIGSVSGLLGMASIVGLCYLVSQVVLASLHLHKPGKFDHNIGIATGLVGGLADCSYRFHLLHQRVSKPGHAICSRVLRMAICAPCHRTHLSLYWRVYRATHVRLGQWFVE